MVNLYKDNPYADGQIEEHFRWLHLRHEKGSYLWVDGAWPHMQWYWEEELLPDWFFNLFAGWR